MQVLDFKKNYFELFELEPGFVVDKALLHANQQMLQSAYHPDRYVNANEQDKRLSVQQASWVNEAYQTLSNPVKRARYLLELNGLELNDETETTSDMTFLMEQLELREQLDDCSHQPDPLACCEQIESKIKFRAQQLADEFVENFESDKFENARIISRKMQFIHRIQAQVLELQFKLEDELG